MRSSVVAWLGGLLLTVATAAWAQARTENADGEPALLRFPGLWTEDIDLSGPAAASFRLPIQYDEHIDAETFAAFLNGRDITIRFHAHAGQREEIALPLSEGENELILSACAKGGDTAQCQSRTVRLVKREIRASFAPIPARPAGKAEETLIEKVATIRSRRIVAQPIPGPRPSASLRSPQYVPDALLP